MITRRYLREHPDHVFVFGDNLLRKGNAGAAYLRTAPNVYGFITKKFPGRRDVDYYEPHEYVDTYKQEIVKLRFEVQRNPDKTYLISRLGSGLANKHGIFEAIIEPNIKEDLEEFENVRFIW